MSALGLTRIAEVVDGAYAGADAAVAAAVIDSRQVQSGDLFVAVPGERVDGHAYIDAAAKQGAVAALVEQPCVASISCIEVDNSLNALSALGAANRDSYHGELIAITGSNGKTSVKHMCDAILQRAGKTVATVGNYNNEIGVPLTLSRLSDETRFAVVEMGATRMGDVAHLCSLARPTISTVLNAMEAHLQGFGSVEEVAQAKAEIFDGLGSDGVAVVNLDQPWRDAWLHRAAANGARVITWSQNGPADVHASAVQDLGLRGTRFELQVLGESRSLALPLPGCHNVANALAAAALCTAAGVGIDEIVAGLAAIEPVAGRLRLQHLPSGAMLVDDSYNANPGSVRAAIALLEATEGASVLVLGEMRELGVNSAQQHREMGALARARGVSRFVGVGPALLPAVEAFGENARWYESREALNEDLEQVLRGAATILVKGSRGAAMESVIAAIREREGLPC